MDLNDARLTASIAVSDMDRARTFYEGKLGLVPLRDQSDGSRIYASGDGPGLHVYPSPASAGKTAGTLATWYVDDLEAVVDELTAKGVRFEQYDDPPIKTDEKGLAGDGTVAWLKDPDGNTLAIEQSRDW
jgi:catechol 2,3-dioxygenase-like lactoylglutathione lyase family enzyme